MSDEEEFHASGPKCTSRERFTRRDKSSRVGKHTLGDQCDSVPWIVSVSATIVRASGKRASGEVFTRRKTYVGRGVHASGSMCTTDMYGGREGHYIVSFSATIRYWQYIVSFSATIRYSVLLGHHTVLAISHHGYIHFKEVWY